MKFPKLKELPATRKMLDTFKGYNHNLRISDGEFSNMKNLTSDYYPVLSPRKRRGVHAKPASPQGLIAKNEICYVDGTDFVIGEDRINMGLSVKAEDCPKKLISMGAYVIIMPDKKYINTMKTEDHGDIEATVTTSGEVSFTLCNLTGDAYKDPVVSATAPSNPSNMDMWIDTSSTPHVLKQYSTSSSMWVSIAATYVKISATGIGKNFAQYDGVTISGVEADALKSLNSASVIWERGDDYIVVVGIVDATAKQTAPVTISRSMPHMDFVIESGNRLWGCRYGTAANGQQVNEIYASKLGDFKNWNCYMSLSTDSYTASCGTEGPFTGAVAHRGYPLFFKENHLHKVYGYYPANYQIQDISCQGVQEGCENSMAIVNEVLFYKARGGVAAYDGSMPTDVSYAFGNEMYGNAVAGALGSKYYISMKDRNEDWHLFVYDTETNLWHREDNLHALAFCASRGELYCIDADDQNIITLLGSGEEDEQVVEWMAETGEIGITSPDMKYISKLDIRMTLDPGSTMNIYAQYDLSDEWEHVAVIYGTALRSFAIPVRPKRCDYMRLRLTGTGPAKIYSITKTIEQGSDVS